MAMNSERSEKTRDQESYTWVHPVFDHLLALSGTGPDEVNAEFIGRIHFHQLLPLYLRSGHPSLQRVDPGTMLRLVRTSQEQTRYILTMVSRFGPISRRLEQQGVRFALYKGPALSQRIFGDIAFRQFSDIDLIVHADDFSRALDLLVDSGLHSSLPPTPFVKTYLKKSRRDFTLGDARLHLDLHQQIARGPRFYSPPAETWSRLDSFTVYGCSHPLLPLETELVTLSVHASRHGWDHYKLVMDFAGLLQVRPDLDWDQVERLIRRFQARPMFDLGIGLCRSLFADAAPQYRIKTPLRRFRETLNRHLAVLDEGRNYTDMSMLKQFFHLQESRLNQVKMVLFYLGYPRPESPLLRRFDHPAFAGLLPLIHPPYLLYRTLRRKKNDR